MPTSFYILSTLSIFIFVVIPEINKHYFSYFDYTLSRLKKLKKKNIKVYRNIEDSCEDTNYLLIKDVWVYNKIPEDDYVICVDINVVDKNELYISRKNLVAVDFDEEIDKIKELIKERDSSHKKQLVENSMKQVERELIINERKNHGLIY